MARRRSFEYACVIFPTRTMNIGMSGRQTRIATALIQSSHTTAASVAGVARHVRMSCGRNLTKYGSSASRPSVASVTVELVFPSASQRCPLPAAESRTRPRSCAMVRRAARWPAASCAYPTSALPAKAPATRPKGRPRPAEEPPRETSRASAAAVAQHWTTARIVVAMPAATRKAM